MENTEVKYECVELPVDDPIAGPSGISLKNLRVPFGAPLKVQKVRRGYVIYTEEPTPVSTKYPPYYDHSNYNTDCYSTYPKSQVIDVNDSYEQCNSKIEYDSDFSEDSEGMERIINNAYQDSLTNINCEDEISFIEEVITIE